MPHQPTTSMTAGTVLKGSGVPSCPIQLLTCSPRQHGNRPWLATDSRDAVAGLAECDPVDPRPGCLSIVAPRATEGLMQTAEAQPRFCSLPWPAGGQGRGPSAGRAELQLAAWRHPALAPQGPIVELPCAWISAVSPTRLKQKRRPMTPFSAIEQRPLMPSCGGGWRPRPPGPQASYQGINCSQQKQRPWFPDLAMQGLNCDWLGANGSSRWCRYRRGPGSTLPFGVLLVLGA